MDNKEFSKKLKLRIYKWTVHLVKYLRVLSKKKYEEIVKVIVNQLTRSGTSVGANYVEADGACSVKDFRKFLSYALKSSNESKYWLALIRDTDIDNSVEPKELLDEIIEISNILGKSVSTMYKKDKK